MRRKPRKKYIRPKYVRIGKSTFVPASGFKMIDLLDDATIIKLHRKYQELSK
jgi:hypothetical protein